MIASDELAALISGITRAGHDIVPVLEVLATLTDDLSRTFVPLDASHGYFEALAHALDVNIGQAQTTLLKRAALAAVCRLTENVASRDPSYLLNPAPVVVPWLIESLGEDESTTGPDQTSGTSILRSLDCMWLACPRPVEEQIREVGLSHSKPSVRLASLTLLSDRISALDGKFAFRKFTPKVTKLVQDPDASVRNAAYALLVQVFSAASPAAFADLQRVMRLLRIPEVVQDRLTARIQRESRVSSPTDGPRSPVPQSPALQSSAPQSSAPPSPALHQAQTSPNTRGPVPHSPSLGSQSPQLSLAPQVQGARTFASQSSSQAPMSPHTPERAPLAPLGVLLDPYFPMQDLEVRHVYSDQQFRAEIDQLLPCFSGKETDTNWSARNAALTTLRQLLRNPTSSVSSREKAQAMRRFTPPITAVLSSLRTTLVLNACQAVKDAFKLFDASVDLAEPYLAALSRLSGLNKKMTASMAHCTVSSMLMSLRYSPRLVAIVRAAIADAKPQSRAYGMVWLQILVVCHGPKPEFNANHAAEVENFVVKGLQDAAPAVRMASRDTFWAMDTQMPASGARVRARLEAVVLRPLDQARPRTSMSPSVIRESFTGANRSLSGSLSPLSPSEKSSPELARRTVSPTLSPTPGLSQASSPAMSPSRIPSRVPTSPSPSAYANSHVSNQSVEMPDSNEIESSAIAECVDTTSSKHTPVGEVDWSGSDLGRSSHSRDLSSSLIRAAPRDSTIFESARETPALDTPELDTPLDTPELDGPEVETQVQPQEPQPRPLEPLEASSGAVSAAEAVEAVEASDPPDVSTMHISPDPWSRRRTRTPLVARPVHVYQDPAPTIDPKDALNIDRGMLTPFPTSASECLALFDRLIADLEAGIITENGLVSLIVLVGSGGGSQGSGVVPARTPALQQWTLEHSMRAAAGLNAYLSNTADRANERVHLALVMLSHLISRGHWTVWTGEFLAKLVAVSQRKYLVTSLEYTALPLVAKSVANHEFANDVAKRFTVEIEVTYCETPGLTRASKVLLLRLLQSMSRVVTPDVGTLQLALDESDARVRREVYPIILAVYKHDVSAGDAVCSDLTAGQARIVEYYRENTPPNWASREVM